MPEEEERRGKREGSPTSSVNGDGPKAEGSTTKESNLDPLGESENGSKKSEEITNRDQFDITVKREFVLESRAASLPPLPELPAPPSAEENASPTEVPKSKKKKGQNKKRPRDVRVQDEDKLCAFIIREEACPFDNCRFSHDKVAYLQSRPADIAVEAFPNGCPTFDTYGFCQYGVACRFAGSHVLKTTGENVRRSPDAQTKVPVVMNSLSKDTQIQLRKKKYAFSCKMRENIAGKIRAERESRGDVKLEPLPEKTRKIIDFSNKVYIAPLTTVGNLPFRRVMKKYGADITCGEMALATNLLEGKASEWALLKRHPEEDIFGIQLAAGYPDVFTRTMELVESQVDTDFVDLNLGCPLDLVCNRGAGASLMKSSNRLHDSLVGITHALQKCPVTVKMRTGWNERDPFAHDLVAKIQTWQVPGIAAVMVHGRSRLQRYSREANWDYIEKVRQNQDPGVPPIPIIGNGDILSFPDYVEKVEKREDLVNCAMLGRGALIKPWLPTEIKERRNWDISASERLDMLKDFVRFGLEQWGSDQQGVNNTRRFLLEWLSFLCRYVPLHLIEEGRPQTMNQRPPKFMCGRSDLETLMISTLSSDWVKLSEMLLGSVPDGFQFVPKHKANSYSTPDKVHG